MVTAKASWIGLGVLFVVVLLVIAAVLSWHHVTGASLVHLFGFFPKGGVGHGC
jgi:hypothetical protein